MTINKSVNFYKLKTMLKKNIILKIWSQKYPFI